MEIAQHCPKVKKNPFHLHSKHDTPASVWGFRCRVVQDSHWDLVLRYWQSDSGLLRYLLSTASRVSRSFYSVTVVMTQKNGISTVRLHDKAQVLTAVQGYSHCLFWALYRIRKWTVGGMQILFVQAYGTSIYHHALTLYVPSESTYFPI